MKFLTTKLRKVVRDLPFESQMMHKLVTNSYCTCVLKECSIPAFVPAQCSSADVLFYYPPSGRCEPREGKDMIGERGGGEQTDGKL